MIPIPISYAEIHYRLPWLKPAYFRNLPEIITDLPTRYIARADYSLPIALIVKDADKFPVTINRVTAYIIQKGRTRKRAFELDQTFSATYRSIILPIANNDLIMNSYCRITLKIDCTARGKQYTFYNDNFPGLDWQPYCCYVTEKPLPYPQGWFAGDPHVHTNYTNDQAEFGADIALTRAMAIAMGLSWFFVADHSYDLDDMPDNYLENDPNLPKWHQMRKEVAELDSSECRILPGEEASIGNARGENVHMLSINRDDFIPGHGDSAENWLENHPQVSLNQLEPDQNGLLIAAHTFEQVPILQKLLLRRGNWSIRDFHVAGIRHLQAINSARRQDIVESLLHWRDLLLLGNRFVILAGNDAHGNFNVMRQISVPFLKLFSSRKQTFGRMMTIFKHRTNDPIAGLDHGEIIVSNGPFLRFQLGKGDHAVTIGQSMKSRKERLFFEAETTPEFGRITRIDLLIGDIDCCSEQRIVNPENKKRLHLPSRGYVRMELRTRNGGFAATNPIWVEPSEH